MDNCISRASQAASCALRYSFSIVNRSIRSLSDMGVELLLASFEGSVFSSGVEDGVIAVFPFGVVPFSHFCGNLWSQMARGQIGAALPLIAPHVDAGSGVTVGGERGIDPPLPIVAPCLNVRAGGFGVVQFARFFAQRAISTHAPGGEYRVKVEVAVIAALRRSLN